MAEPSVGKDCQPLHALFWLTLATGAPLWLAIGSDVICRLTEPPSFPGDPGIGAGLIDVVALLNLPILGLAWIGWGLWAWLRTPRNNPTD
ncbi:MAG: hypothetical protein SH850_06270 [Planctomycetaceae bacterium]|nr:hypothetical protein [Planctomycetaceae bacterium]